MADLGPGPLIPHIVPLLLFLIKVQKPTRHHFIIDNLALPNEPDQFDHMPRFVLTATRRYVTRGLLGHHGTETDVATVNVWTTAAAA